MSEKQAKRQRAMAAELEDHSTRLTACEAALNSAYAIGREFELQLKDTALKEIRADLKRARRRALYYERSAWKWQGIAGALLIAASVAVIMTIIL